MTPRNIIVGLAIGAMAGWATCGAPAARLVWAQQPRIVDEAATERAAQTLLGTTVTLRIAPQKRKGNGKPQDDGSTGGIPSKATPADDRQRQGSLSLDGVTVCSGTSLGGGLILSFVRCPAGEGSMAADFAFRITLPGGEQAAAVPQVIDHYSGLVLLEIAKKDLPGLKPADALPPVGGVVLTAAASGIEKPLVSMGVLSGVDRTIHGTDLPPMIQCDISTTAASSGAAIIDRNRRLIGIVAATGAERERFGWTYAVPVAHVRRLLEARAEGKLVELVRSRPSAGLLLGAGPEEGTVLVERVVPGGPADAAGIRAGDLVLEAEGCTIRSAYQAVALILKHQPGEAFSFVVQQEGKRKKIEMTLGGGAALVADARPKTPSVEVGPQVNLRVAGRDRIEVRSGGHVAELAVDPTASPERSPGNEMELLKAQLQAYQNVIIAMQKELRRSQTAEKETAARLQALQQELDRLKKQLPAEAK